MPAPEPDDPWSTRRCPSCGAVVTQAPERVSHGCSYCGSALVEAERAAVAIDRVAPFRLSAKAADERLREHLAARWWAPERLRRAARDGSIDARLVEGVLVPFYAYDATCRSRYETRVGLHWHETKTVYENGERKQEVERHTEWFPLRGTAVHQLRDHLVSASAGLSAVEVSALCPFDLGRARPFDARLMAGWPAELPSRARGETDRDAAEQIRAREIRRIGAEHLPGDIHRDTRVSCQVELGEAELVLLPVWVAALRYAGKTHRLVVNGQTGRCHGSAPVSPLKLAVAVTLAVIVAALLAWRLSS
jgi:predicted  nucleic acid-binding Zn-ribbon protein